MCVVYDTDVWKGRQCILCLQGSLIHSLRDTLKQVPGFPLYLFVSVFLLPVTAEVFLLRCVGCVSGVFGYSSPGGEAVAGGRNTGGQVRTQGSQGGVG